MTDLKALSDALLPCPFCGGEAQIDLHNLVNRVGCPSCGAWLQRCCSVYTTAESNDRAEVENAAKAWNNRPHLQAARDAALEEAALRCQRLSPELEFRHAATAIRALKGKTNERSA